MEGTKLQNDSKEYKIKIKNQKRCGHWNIKKVSIANDLTDFHSVNIVNMAEKNEIKLIQEFAYTII